MKRSQAGELDDVVEAGVDVPLRQAEDRPVEVDVLTARQIGVEARAQLQQGGEPAVTVTEPWSGRRIRDQALEQGALAGPVLADDGEHVALADVERHALQGPELLVPGPPATHDDAFRYWFRSWKIRNRLDRPSTEMAAGLAGMTPFWTRRRAEQRTGGHSPATLPAGAAGRPSGGYIRRGGPTVSAPGGHGELRLPSELAGVEPRAALAKRAPGRHLGHVRQPDHGGRRYPVTGHDVRDEAAVAARLGDAAPQVVVLPAVEPAIGGVPIQLVQPRPADERHSVDVVHRHQPPRLPGEDVDEPGRAVGVEAFEHSVGEPRSGIASRAQRSWAMQSG